MGICGVVFPGQGSQTVGMGRYFYDTFQESREVFEEASSALGLDMPALCFNENEQLNQTEFTQPAILTTEIAMFTAIKKRYNLAPQYFAGHSLGEYTALVAANVLQFRDAVQIVRKRGYLMQGAVPQGLGSMAALIMGDIAKEDLSQILTDAGINAANYNSQDQVVISGMKEGVTKACEQLAAKYPTMRIVPLNVSAPFHSKHMAVIGAEFEAYLRSFPINLSHDGSSKVLSNFLGGFHSSAGLVSALVEQLSGPVRWMENMRAMSEKTAEIYEIGPARVLSRFFSTIGVEIKTITDARSLERTLGSVSTYAV